MSTKPLKDDRVDPLTYEEIYEVVRGTGWVTRGQADEIAEKLLAARASAPPMVGQQAPIAFMTTDEEGAPAMLFFDKQEAYSYCGDGEEPVPLMVGEGSEPVAWDGLYRDNCEDGALCLHGCHSNEACCYATPTPPLDTSARQGWKPISSAPKDELILVGPTKRMGICAAMHHSRDGWVTETCSEWMSIYTPTHWMSLPAEPRAGGEVDGVAG